MLMAVQELDPFLAGHHLDGRNAGRSRHTSTWDPNDQQGYQDVAAPLGPHTPKARHVPCRVMSTLNACFQQGLRALRQPYSPEAKVERQHPDSSYDDGAGTLKLAI